MSMGAYDTSALRPTPIVAGLGPELERYVLGDLEEVGAVEVVQRCLSGDHLRAAAASGQVEAAIVSTDLHGLTDGLLEQIHLPVVVMTDDPDALRWQGRQGLRAVPREAEAGAVREALLAALRGERTRPTTPVPGSATPVVTDETVSASETAGGRIVLVTKFRGAPGATKIATSLDVLLDRHGSAVLLDLDPAAATVVYGDADPTRSVYLVAYADPDTPEAWERTLASELQPLCKDSGAALLAGVQKPEQRGVLAPGFVRQLLEQLRQRFDWILVDLSLDGLLGRDQEAGLVRTVLDAADTILLVGATDLVGLWHTRQALRLLQGERDRVRLVLNRYDRQRHYALPQIAFELGEEPLATIPYDYDACARAIEAQRPVALDGHGRAGRALQDLADRLRDPSGAQERGRAPGPRVTWGRRDRAASPVAATAATPQEEDDDAHRSAVA